MKIEYKEGLIVLKDQDEEVGYIKYVRKEENVKYLKIGPVVAICSMLEKKKM